MADPLFPVYNNFFIGNYQVAINEGYELQGLSANDAIERDCYVYRSHVALGHHQLVLDEITDESPPRSARFVSSLSTSLASTSASSASPPFRIGSPTPPSPRTRRSSSSPRSSLPRRTTSWRR